MIWIIGGVVLWQKKALGYVIGAGLIFQACTLFIGLLIYFILQPLIFNLRFLLNDFIVIFFMGWFCYIPFILFVRGIIKSQNNKMKVIIYPFLKRNDENYCYPENLSI